MKITVSILFSLNHKTNPANFWIWIISLSFIYCEIKPWDYFQFYISHSLLTIRLWYDFSLSGLPLAQWPLWSHFSQLPLSISLASCDGVVYRQWKVLDSIHTSFYHSAGYWTCWQFLAPYREVSGGEPSLCPSQYALELLCMLRPVAGNYCESWPMIHYI